jgi:hypothetical protein
MLETRCLLSANPLPTVLEIENNNTLDHAQVLGNLTGPVSILGAIGNSPAGAADVDWYTFTLTQATSLTLKASPQAGRPGPVLSLYNNDPFDFNDLYDPLGHRLLAQAPGGSKNATNLNQALAAGTYFVAVSGAGNQSFQPFVQGSGYPGSTGNYTLQLSTTDLGLTTNDGPIVLSATPGKGASLDRSPLILRVDLSGSLNAKTVIAGQTVRLTYNPTGAFGNQNDQDVPLAGVSYSDQIAELQLVPATSLAPGCYQVFLAGNQSGGTVLADPNGMFLGKSLTNPKGRDFTVTFRITGIEGNPASPTSTTSDDSPTTAHELGNIAGLGLVQRSGAIGADPAYSFASPDPLLANPAADVDLYHFKITGKGQFALTAEVFAGRIGSPLDPALALFQLDTTTNQLVFVDSNDNSLNYSEASDGSQPLSNDAVLLTGLKAGDYYLAVSGTSNMPASEADILPGANTGVYNPNISHSGQNGFTTGDYILNVSVQGDSVAPQVKTVSLSAGANLSASPTTFSVTFSKPVDLEKLIYQTYQQSFTPALGAVFIRAADPQHPGQTIDSHPRLISYDPISGVANFLMLNAVANGPAELHLSGSGPLGITDLAGNPLVGNTEQAGGDYVVSFTVNGPSRGTNGNSLLWTSQEPNNTPQTPQPLGVLFPLELQAGVVVKRSSPPGTTDQTDYYAFEVLQGRDYFVSLTGSGIPANAKITLRDAAGNLVSGIVQGSGGRAFRFSLDVGQYVLGVENLTPVPSGGVKYNLRISLANSLENPPPLTLGPAPAIRLTPPDDPSALPSGPTPPVPVAAVSAVGDASAVDSGLTRLPALSGPATPGPVGIDVTPSILLTRVTGTVGVWGEDSLSGGTVSEVAISGGDQVQPFQSGPQLVSTSVVASAEGQPALPVEETQGQPAPGPGPNVALKPTKEPVTTVPSPTPTSPSVSVKGMPGKVALDALFEMESLRADLPRAAGNTNALSADVSEMALSGFAPLPSGGPTTPTWWLDLLTLASACASLTLGGWCTVRLSRRRAGSEKRICWEEEGSSELLS